MTYLTLEDSRALEEAIQLIQRGGVVAFPTDTVYGMGASLQHPEALRRVYDLKGRSPDKPLPILISRAEMIDRLSPEPDESLIELAMRFWPGPLTIVVPADSSLPGEVKAPDGTIGVRMPNHSIPLAIAERNGGAIAVTSANLTGHAPTHSAAEIRDTHALKVDLVLDGGRSPQENASTVIRVEDGDLVILREGVIDRQTLTVAWTGLEPQGSVRIG